MFRNLLHICQTKWSRRRFWEALPQSGSRVRSCSIRAIGKPSWKGKHCNRPWREMIICNMKLKKEDSSWHQVVVYYSIIGHSWGYEKEIKGKLGLIILPSLPLSHPSSFFLSFLSSFHPSWCWIQQKLSPSWVALLYMKNKSP